jgi:hypothetical protein
MVNATALYMVILLPSHLVGYTAAANPKYRLVEHAWPVGLFRMIASLFHMVGYNAAAYQKLRLVERARTVGPVLSLLANFDF